MTGRIRLAALLCAALLVAVCTSSVRAEQRIANISQGTNLSLAIFPDRESLVIDLLGRLWRLPASGGGATQLTPDDEAARHPRVSPDGRLIVYQRLIDGHWDLWLLDVETAERRPLLATAHDEREPDFAPDGRSVVFVSDLAGPFSLWRVDIDTGVLTQLTAEPGDASFPAVSAHGEIAYVRREPDGWSLRALLPTAASIELYRSRNRIAAPSWREGGGVVVFNEQRAAVDAAPPISELKMLVLSARPVVKTLTRAEDVFESRAAWASPGVYFYAADGRIWRRGIAYASRDPVHLFAAVALESSVPPPVDTPLDAPGPNPVHGVAGRSASADGRVQVVSALGDLWLVERRGDPRRLTDDPFVDVEPSVSPDGDFAVFASDRGGYMDLWRISLPGGVLTQLTRTPARDHSPAVSPDGRSVAFIEADAVDPLADGRLAVVPAAGGAARTIASRLTGADAPRWEDQDRVSLELLDKNAEPQRLTYDATTGRPTADVPRAAARETEEPSPLPAIEWRAAEPDEPYAVQVGRLFDATRSDYIRHVDVHIEGQRIKAIVARGLLPLPERVIDLRDATIIPGLIDVHAHQSSLLGERLGRAWLAHGVTTVREVAADVPAALERAESWASGRRLGPRLIVSPDGAATPATAEDAAAPARRETAVDAPAVQYPVPVRAYANLRSTPSVFRPAANGAPAHVEAAHSMASIGSAFGTSPLGLAYDDVFNTLTESRTVLTSSLAAASGVSATVPALRKLIRHPLFERIYTADERGRWLSAADRPDARRTLQQHLLRLIRAGGLAAVGSASPDVPYGLGVHLDMALLADAGVPPDQVLRIATAGNALALGLERQLGTLEAGKLADFLVVEGDPLRDVAAALDIVAVVRGGVWLDRATLVR